MTEIDAGHRRQEVRISKLTSEKIGSGFGPMIIISSEIGQARHLAHIASYVRQRTGNSLYFIDQGIATKELDSRFPERVKSDLPDDASLILTCEDNPDSYVVESILRAKSNSPKALICVSAGGPFEMVPLFELMFPVNLAPDLVLPNTISQAEFTKQYFLEQSRIYPDLNLQDIPVIPIGHTDFDEKIKHKKAETRHIYEVLGIPQDAKVFTYIGIKDGVIEKAPNINTETLVAIGKALAKVGTNYPDEAFYLVNRPHPAQEHWKNTEIEEIDLPDNVYLINKEREEWPDLSTTDLCLASFASITTVSTVQHEVILFNGLDKDGRITIPIYLHLEPESKGIISYETRKTIQDGAAVVAHSIEELEAMLTRLLSNEELANQLKGTQKQMVEDYRIKGEYPLTSMRAYLWMKKLLQTKQGGN